MGILKTAKEALALKSMLVILESPAQHFVYDIDAHGNQTSDHGNYSGVFYPHIPFHRDHKPGPCCSPTENTALGNYRNVALKAALTALDPSWRDYVGWVHFYDMTQKSYPNHVDGGADCTHFAWSPFFYEPLFQELESEIIRLDDLILKMEEKEDLKE